MITFRIVNDVREMRGQQAFPAAAALLDTEIGKYPLEPILLEDKSIFAIH